MFLTADKNLTHQQNLKRRKIVVVAIGNAQLPALRPHVEKVVGAVSAAKPGSYTEVEIP